MNKRVTAIGLTAGLLAGAGAGFIIEQSGSAGASSRPAAVVAVNNGEAGLDTILQPLVDDGTLTAGQMSKVIAALQAAHPMGRGIGDGGPGRGGPGRGAELDAVASLLGMTTSDLRTAVQGGQTLAQIAQAHGKTAQDVIDVIVADVKEHFATEVASGEHTQAEADQRIADVTARITDMVNSGHGGPGMGRHDHPGDSSDTPAAAGA